MCVCVFSLWPAKRFGVRSNACNHSNEVIFEHFFFCLSHRNELQQAAQRTSVLFCNQVAPSWALYLWSIEKTARKKQQQQLQKARKKTQHIVFSSWWCEWCAIVRATVRSPHSHRSIIAGARASDDLYMNWIWIENYLDTWLTCSASALTGFNTFYYPKNVMRVKNTCFSSFTWYTFYGAFLSTLCFFFFLLLYFSIFVSSFVILELFWFGCSILLRSLLNAYVLNFSVRFFSFRCILN